MRNRSELSRPARLSGSQSPVIWRCARCGGLVHVADPDHPAASCMRCGGIVPAVRDGGAEDE
ncbi:MAG TPA: hypothetical protein VE991_01115 [Acidimicrobiales bacterium]|nr:hypothetical protein [Acidimicrobiales bacterium]